MALPVYGGIGPPERTGLRLACSRTALRSALDAGIGRVTLLITYGNHNSCAPSPRLRQIADSARFR
jgi:hypothetical protein